MWLPEVSPSRALVAYARGRGRDRGKWAASHSAISVEMRRPEAMRPITLLAALSRKANFSIGCYCENPLAMSSFAARYVLREQGGKVHPYFR